MASELVKIGQIPIPKVPKDWDAEQSIVKTQELISEWRRLGIEACIELWCAWKTLKDVRNINVANATLTWTGYCGAVSVNKATAWRKFIELGWLPKPERLIEYVELPSGKFDVIYMDPPWRYDFSPTDNRKIENKYQTLTVQEIIEYEKDGVTLVDKFWDNAVLFMWATAPKLREAMIILDSWEFSYKTNAVWDKEIIGMGYWFRGEHEELLIATKGNFSPPPPELRLPSVFTAKRTDHSRKPKYFYDMIESMLPGHKYFEAFLRGKPHNERWVGMGLEMEKSANG